MRRNHSSWVIGGDIKNGLWRMSESLPLKLIMTDIPGRQNCMDTSQNHESIFHIWRSYNRLWNIHCDQVLKILLYQAKNFELDLKKGWELLSVWKVDTDIISKLFWYNHSDNVDDGLGEKRENRMEKVSIKAISITQVRANENLN